MVKICNMDCLNCIYADCINNEDPSDAEMAYMEYIDKEIIDKHIVGVSDLDMGRYIYKREDAEKEDYNKARDREHDKKREGCAARKKAHKKYYQKNRDKRLSYDRDYYEKNKEEKKRKARLYYEKNKEKINEKRRLERMKKNGINWTAD